MNTNKMLWVVVVTLEFFYITHQLMAADERQVPSASRLAFSANGMGDLSFDTGVVKGTLTKDGLGEALKTITFNDGNVVVDQNHGLFCPYRFLTPQRRYGFGSWEWPRTGKVLENGSAQLLWGSAPDRPFAFSTVYRWKSADTLDCTVFFTPQTNLAKFEFFLGSYFDKFTKAKVYVKDALNGMPGLIEVTKDKGQTQLFPINEEVLPIVRDGRWKFPPFPMNWTIRSNLADPLGMRTEPASGVTVLIMAPPEDCFAMSTWQQNAPQGGCYLSLFGKDVRQGQTLVAHARLVFGKNIADSRALEKYADYLKEIKGDHDDALLTSTETEAMRQIFASPPSDANAVKPPAWLSPDLPKPDADGWIRLFDGKHLYGCTLSAADLESRKVELQNGLLRLDSAALRFNVNCGDVDIRARLKKVSGRSSNIDVRWTKGTNNWRGYATWFNGGNSFGAGRNDEKGWRGLIDAHTPQKYNNFFDMEVVTVGDTLTLKADGQTIGSISNDFIARGSFGVLARQGTTLIERIEVRILDKKPAGAGL